MDTISVAGRADLTDAQWAVLEPLLPKGIKPGRPLADKAYSSKANRSYRRRRHIRPPSRSRMIRRPIGTSGAPKGGRPPVFDAHT